MSVEHVIMEQLQLSRKLLIASGYEKATAADIQKANTLFNESVNQ